MLSRKLICFMLSLLLLSACGSKKSALGAEISKTPEPLVIDETQLERLSEMEDDYYLLFCDEKDTVHGCSILLKEIANCTLNNPSALYVFYMEPILWFTRLPDTTEDYEKIFEEGMESFSAFFSKQRLRSIPALQHRSQKKITDSFYLLNTENTLQDLPAWLEAQ
ncbi:hypothetical protein [Holdemania massiliensis]|uniref:hypothetical protein n=1 Tax=Holdemania massiliensis TaxID=1468449 RepID=UPI001F0636FB|nr:hypothetical protein [Holdemania massiliensis]MCH1939785.1 hypothetical protein [Holdemania massiliensis]